MEWRRGKIWKTGDLPGELVVVEIDDVEVGAEGELRGDLAGEPVGREVEHGEVHQRLQVRGDGAGESVGGEVKGLEVGAVGEEGRDGAPEGEVREGELVDAAIVADDAVEVRGEPATGVGEGGLGPVQEAPARVLQRLCQPGQAELVSRIRSCSEDEEEEENEGGEQPDEGQFRRRWHT